MRIIALDFESFFSDDYTLKKLTTEHYIRDERLEAHGAAIKWSQDHAARWYAEPELRHVLAQEDWSDTSIIAHHAQFDGLILGRHYSVRPKLWLDTLSMARLLLGNHLSVSLDSVRKQFGLPAKRTPYEIFKGKHWPELTADERTLIADGCCDEVESIWMLFGILAREFPASEYGLVDTTIRMFTEPTLRGDTELLAKIWSEEHERKHNLQKLVKQQIQTARKLELESGRKIDDDDSAYLQSNDRFAALLRAEDIDPALKQGKNGPIYAFAKTDDFMKELLDHDDPRVSGLARARLGIKSTAIQTRCETLGFMVSRGPLCVYLRYCGANTTRWSGGDSSNFQNFKRGNALRKTVCAPDGFDLAVIDSSQIECRVLNYLAGQWDVVERFARGEDPYVGLASEFYGRPITKADVAERGAGKQGELMCGYGCGGPKFSRVARMGLYGPPIIIDDAEGARRVDIYRTTHPAVTAYWREAEQVLGDLANNRTREWGPLTIRNRKIYLPTGLRMNYDTLEWYEPTEEDLDYAMQTGKDHEANYGRRGWRLKTRQGWSFIWGSKLVQHVCEMVARAIVGGEAMLRIKQQGLRIVGMSHDEIWVLIPRDNTSNNPMNQQQDLFEFCLDAMRTAPAWLPGIPLDAEGTMGDRYAK